MVIYVDIVMALNCLVDFLLLLGTNRLAGFPAETVKCARSAGLGAIYSGVCLLPGFSFLGNGLWRTVFLCLMAVLAFGFDRSTVRRGGVFVMLSMALGGVALGMGSSGGMGLLLAAGGLWAVCRFGLKRVGEQTCIPVILRRDGKEMKLLALRDTGNTLRDPLTGEQVLVAGVDVAVELLGLTEEQLRHPVETLSREMIPGARLLPYCAVGQKAGMLLAVRFSGAVVGNRPGDPLVAFAPQVLGRGEGYQMLTGGIV